MLLIPVVTISIAVLVALEGGADDNRGTVEDSPLLAASSWSRAFGLEDLSVCATVPQSPSIYPGWLEDDVVCPDLSPEAGSLDESSDDPVLAPSGGSDNQASADQDQDQEVGDDGQILGAGAPSNDGGYADEDDAGGTGGRERPSSGLAVNPLPGGESGSGVREAFIAGYRAGNGNPAYLGHFLNVVIPCESSWNPLAVSSGGHLGLAQFSADSWRGAGGGDYRDPYQQGLNTARWVALTIDRGTSPRSQWSCW